MRVNVHLCLCFPSAQCWGTATPSARCTDSPWPTAPSSQPTQRANWSGLQPLMNRSSTCHCTSCKGVATSFLSFSTISRDVEQLIGLKPQINGVCEDKSSRRQTASLSTCRWRHWGRRGHSHLHPFAQRSIFIPYIFGAFHHLLACKSNKLFSRHLAMF